MVKISGDFAKLSGLIEKVGSAKAELRDRALKVLAEESVTQVKLGFRAGRDPYGQPWALLKVRQGKPLIDTSRMRNSFTWAQQSDGFVVGTNVEYAPYHQHGTRNVPQRMMMPDPSRGLGDRWQKAFDAAMTAVVRAHFGK